MTKRDKYNSALCFHFMKACVVAFFLVISSLLIMSCESQYGYGSDKDGLSTKTTLTRTDDNALTLPPGADNNDVSPRKKLEGLQGLKGVNVDQLFSENIRDTDRRFDRLEDVVKDFRREYESVKPEIIRLVAIEKDMQKLIELLNQDVGLPDSSPEFVNYENDPIAMDQEPLELSQNQTVPQIQSPSVPESEPVAPQPSPVPKVEKASVQDQVQNQTMPSKATSAGKSQLTGFRFGEHSDFTRLVIDGSLETTYKLDLDSSGEILKITVPNASWSGATTKDYPSNALLQSYSAQSNPSTGETDIYVSFKKPVKVINQGGLKSGTAPKFRIFVDIR